MASTSKTKTATSVGKSAQQSSGRSPKSPTPPKQKKSKGSIGLGLLLIVIGTSLVGLGGLGYLFYQELLSGSKREISRSAESQSRQFESKLANVRQSVDGVAIAAKVLAQQQPKPKAVETYQKLLADGLQKSDAIAGLGIAQNENLLFIAPKPTVSYVWTEKSGLKIEAGKKLPAPNDKFLFGNRADLLSIPQYKSPFTIAKESWSEPYSAFGKTFITYSAPIIDGQKVLGVINADAIASNLVSISSASPNDESKIGFVVVSASGAVITASDQFQTTQAQNPATTEAIKDLARQSKAQSIGVAQVGGNLWAYRKIEGSDWLVAAYLPESEITNKLFVLVGGAALGISTILAIAVLGFISSLKKRLQPLSEECDRFLNQQGSANPDLAGKDEIDRLSLSLKSTLQQVKTNEIRLRNELASNPSVEGDISAAQAKQSIAETELMESEVGDLLDVVSSMEEGDLTIEAQVNDRATGLVADTLNRLREKLVEIISSVLGTAQQVAQGASDLEELARTVVLNTAEQAQSVSQGQALTAQVAAIAERSSAQVNVANQSLQEVRNTVTSGQTAINNLTESITVLQTGSARIVQRMKTLGEFVGLAEQFVQDQGQIASLTQVLALNATLVAARAAEQKDPKQFTGVAREFEAIAGQVNDLATQTNEGLTVLQQRTSQIQTVVTAIDVEVQNLSGLVTGFTTGVEDSQSAFNSIQTATQEVVQIGQTITESSSEIANAASSTASYISEISQLADRTADLTRSARQQAESMGNQAQQLLQGIQFFRLPDSSHVVTPNNTVTANTTKSEINSLVDRPDTSVNSLLDSSTEADDNQNLGIAIPALAVAATTATVFAISQLGQSSSDKSSLEEVQDETALDGKYLESLLDDSNLDENISNEPTENAASYEPSSNDYPVGLESPQEQSFVTVPEDAGLEESANSFLNVTEELPYSELTDISIIEESLLADLRQEVYDESSFFDEYDRNSETSESLKNPMEGVDEFAIVEASSDPVIVSATSSFLEDTAFGTPAPISEDAIANLPTSVDFSIPDLDDHNFTIPKMEIESTLDNSNSFFDADSIQQTNIEEDFDPFAIAQTVTELDEQSITEDNVDDVFSSSYPSENILDESILDESISNAFMSDQVEDYSNYVSNDRFDETEEPYVLSDDFYEVIPEEVGASYEQDYNNYVSDEEFAQPLEAPLESPSNEVISNTFSLSVDESPFDASFELETSSDIFDDSSYQDQYQYIDPDNLDGLEQTTSNLSGNLEDQEGLADLPSQIPDIYLDELTDDESIEEFSFEFQNELPVETTDLDESNLSQPSEEFGDPFDIDFDVQEEEYLVQDENYWVPETAIALEPETTLNPEIESEEFVFEDALDMDSDYSSDDSDHIFDSPVVEQVSEEFANAFDVNSLENLEDEFQNPLLAAIEAEEFTFGLEYPTTDPETLEESDNVFGSSSLVSDNAIASTVSTVQPISPQEFADIAYDPSEVLDLPDFLESEEDLIRSEPSTTFEMPDFSSDYNSDFALPDLSALTDQDNLLDEDFNLSTSDNFDTLSQTLDREESPIAFADNTEDSDLSLILNSISNQSWANEQGINIENPAIITEESLAEDAFSNIFEEDVDINVFADANEPVTSLLDFNETIETTNAETDLEFGVAVNMLEESAVFEVLPNDLSDLQSESQEVSSSSFFVESLDDNQIETGYVSPDDMSNISVDFSEDLSDDWLDEIMPDESENIDDFADLADLSIVQYPSIDEISPDMVAGSSYGFADNLLDSLMEESGEEVADLSEGLPETSTNVDFYSNESFAINTLSDDLSNDSEFDFSAFEDLVDEVDNTNINTETSDSKPKINTTVSARDEIDDFLSSSIGIDNKNPKPKETSSTKTDDSLKSDIPNE